MVTGTLSPRKGQRRGGREEEEGRGEEGGKRGGGREEGKVERRSNGVRHMNTCWYAGSAQNVWPHS